MSASRSKSASAVLLALAVLPAILALEVILEYGVDVLRMDDWSIARLFVKIEDGTLSFADLARQHNEVRPFFPRLVMIGIAEAAGYNAKYAMLFSFSMACLVSWNLYATGRRTLGGSRRRGLLLLAAANLLIFSVVQSPNWLWAIQIVAFLTLAALTSCLALGCSRASVPVKFAVAMGLCTVATFSMSAGMLCWFAVLPALVVVCWGDLESRTRWIGLWLAAAAINLLLYFAGYERPDAHTSPWRALEHPVDLVTYVLAYLGGPFASTLGENRRAAVLPSAIFGASLMAILFAACAYLARFGRETDLWRRAAPWLAIAAFAVASGAMAGAGRLDFGTHQALTPRYATWALYLPVSLLYLVAILLGDARRRGFGAAARRVTAGGLSVAGLTLLLAHAATSLHHFRGLAETRQQHLTARAALALINVAPEERLLQRRVFPWVDRLEQRANALDRRGLLRPPLIASDRVREIAGVRTAAVYGAIERRRFSGDELLLQGWAVLPERAEPAHAVLLCAQTGETDARIVAVVGERRERPDVVEKTGRAAYRRSGWLARLPRSRLPGEATRVTAWAFDAFSYRAYQLEGAVAIDGADRL